MTLALSHLATVLSLPIRQIRSEAEIKIGSESVRAEVTHVKIANALNACMTWPLLP